MGAAYSTSRDSSMPSFGSVNVTRAAPRTTGVYVAAGTSARPAAASGMKVLLDPRGKNRAASRGSSPGGPGALTMGSPEGLDYGLGVGFVRRNRGRRWNPRTHERRDLFTRHGPAKIGHRPSGLKDQWCWLVDVVEQKDALGEGGQNAIGFRTVQRSRRRPLETIEHARLVAIRLKPADEPGADIRESLVVEIDRILRREHDADTERAGLFEQREQRLLSTAGSRPAGNSRRSRP